MGIDLEKDYVRFANENLEINYPSLKNIVEFHNIDLLKNDKFDKFDFIDIFSIFLIRKKAFRKNILT